jgi:hypothetical protein
MRAYLFIETGEERKPKVDEYFMNICGSAERCCQNDTGNRAILALHEIDIPDVAKELKIITGSLCDLNTVVKIIPIHRPKAKVKKWEWVVDKGVGRSYYASGVHRTEEQIRYVFPNSKWYHRIDETEIEEEE